jgi:DNA-binding NarL/FixJ family response regulator
MFQASESLLDGAAGFGYLLKDRIVDVPQFLDSLMRVANGGSAIDPEIVSHMLGRKSRERDLDVLSERELEVLALMAEGRTNHAIGEHMTITTRAAEKHVSSIFTKLDLEATPDDHRRVLAVLKYLELQ